MAEQYDPSAVRRGAARRGCAVSRGAACAGAGRVGKFEVDRAAASSAHPRIPRNIRYENVPELENASWTA